MNVIDWLLDSDPAIRWQTLDGLTDAPPDEVAAERARVAREGWGAEVLALQEADGRWNGGTLFPYWITTAHALQLLCAFGIDPESEEAKRAVAPVHEAARWEYDTNMRFFDGEVEPCINGRTVAIGSYFGRDMRPVVDRLLTEQMADGGWNCEQENGSTRGSFDTTLGVLEGLLEFERTGGADRDVTAARGRAEEYLLERRLLRRLSDGEIGQKRWLYAGFPEAWFYTLPRVLDYFRQARPGPDDRMAEAFDILESKRDKSGRWPIEHVYNDATLIDFGEREGAPSRWITLRCLRALRWAGRDGSTSPA